MKRIQAKILIRKTETQVLKFLDPVVKVFKGLGSGSTALLQIKRIR